MGRVEESLESITARKLLLPKVSIPIVLKRVHDCISKTNNLCTYDTNHFPSLLLPFSDFQGRRKREEDYSFLKGDLKQSLLKAWNSWQHYVKMLNSLRMRLREEREKEREKEKEAEKEKEKEKKKEAEEKAKEDVEKGLRQRIKNVNEDLEKIDKSEIELRKDTNTSLDDIRLRNMMFQSFVSLLFGLQAGLNPQRW
ncbi:hypothetical protein C5167_024740 [Papaver somniferum]|uniref:Uncharacterized protein n=1 Tax=Papaver somniferum TaxID=3469 RepID=A0A4Y7JSE4_PAPSO|nr:hypothetical protein C5167_024740 [Papaver somniferum]